MAGKDSTLECGACEGSGCEECDGKGRRHRFGFEEGTRPLNWYALFRLSGLSLDRLCGDGVGRFTRADKTLILVELERQCDALEVTDDQ